MNIVIFGGSFDPIHQGHIDLICLSKKYIPNLDRLFIIPTGDHPEKKKYYFSSEERMFFLREIFTEEKFDFVEILDDEIKSSEICYTYDTVQKIKKDNPSAKIHLLIGSDQAEKFSSWHKSQQLAREVILWCADRSNLSVDPQFEWNKIPFDYSISSTEIKYLIQNEIQKFYTHKLIPDLVKDFIRSGKRL